MPGFRQNAMVGVWIAPLPHRHLARGISSQFLRPNHAGKGAGDALKAGQGTIVNVTSIAGSRVHNFAGTAYATSKAALSAVNPRDGE